MVSNALHEAITKQCTYILIGFKKLSNVVKIKCERRGRASSGMESKLVTYMIYQMARRQSSAKHTSVTQETSQQVEKLLE